MLPRHSRAGLILSHLPLYAGPLLAGWGGLTGWTIPAFGLIFAALMLHRRPQPPVMAALTVVVNAGVAGLVFVLGGLAAWLTVPLDMPMWGALGLSALGALWLAHRYRHQPELDALLDDALAAIDGAARDTPRIDWADLAAARPPVAAAPLLDALLDSDRLWPEDLDDLHAALLRAPDRGDTIRQVLRHADFGPNGLIAALTFLALPQVDLSDVEDATLEDLLNDALDSDEAHHALALARRVQNRVPPDLIARIAAQTGA